jgi:hypothetical protein
MEARLRQELGCKLNAGRRRVGESDWNKHPLMRSLIWIANDQNRSPGLAQQRFELGGREHTGESAPRMTAGHDEVNILRLCARRDSARPVSNTDVDTICRAGAAEPAVNLALKQGPGLRSPGFDHFCRQVALDDIKYGQMTLALACQPRSADESDFRGPGKVMCHEHPIPARGVRIRKLQRRDTAPPTGWMKLARMDAGY